MCLASNLMCTFHIFALDQNIVHDTKKLRVNLNDFQIKDLIGKGYYGEVHLAIENVTHDVYAIKKIPKISFAQSKERNIMAISRSDWIPALQYAFQVSLPTNIRTSTCISLSRVITTVRLECFAFSLGSDTFVPGNGIFARR